LSEAVDNQTPSVETPSFGSRPERAMLVVAVIVVVAAILAFILVFRFAQADRERGLQAWQNQLNIVADSRAAAVADWFGNARTAMQKVAANQSLSFYLP
jgi:hypothetical protein